jgi:hypothetical protein
MHLEPQACGSARECLVDVLGLEPEARKQGRGHARSPVGQDLISVSEPVPFGVFIVVQVPAGTFFQALPW